MPENKKQLMRLIKLVAELKENRYPNRHSFAEKLRKSDIDGNMKVSCKVADRADTGERRRCQDNR